MATSKKSRKQLQTEFNQSLYLAASYFKMNSFSNGEPAADGSVLDPTALEKRVNQSVQVVGPLPNFPHPRCETRVILPKEPWRKQKQKQVVRGAEEVAKFNKSNN